MADINRQILVALIAKKLEDEIRDSIRNHGEILKALGVDKQDVLVWSTGILQDVIAVLEIRVT